MLGLSERFRESVIELADDAREFGGFRLLDEPKVASELCVSDLALSAVRLFCLFLSAASLALRVSGTPSHLEFTFGTVGGSFWVETPGSTAISTRPLFSAACLLCCAANCSSAICDGSFSDRNPNMEFPFFFFFFWLLGGVSGRSLRDRLYDVEYLASDTDGRVLEVQVGLKGLSLEGLIGIDRISSSSLVISPLEEVDNEL